jgi:hypothetical protein
MSDSVDGNTTTIAELRTNEGRVGGNFEAVRWSWCITAAARVASVNCSRA